MSDNPPYKILIVDDVLAVREALRWAFEDIEAFVIIGEADDGLKALERAVELKPDVVILDIELPALDGYEVARSLKALPQPPVVIFLTMHNDAASQQRGMEAGGDGFVDKSAGWQELINQIQQLMIGRQTG